MKKCTLFLPGRYPEKQVSFYKKLARGGCKIAVDGGYNFFTKVNVTPDVLIGDLDSLSASIRKLPRKTKVVRFQRDKDKTDTQLALEYAVQAGAEEVDIVQPSIGQPDHFLANAMLLTRYPAGLHTPDVRLVNHRCEIRYLVDQKLVLSEAVGDTVSVISLSQSITLSCSGTAFDVQGLRVERGMTISARNRIVSSRAVFEVRGEALIIRLYGKSNR